MEKELQGERKARKEFTTQFQDQIKQFEADKKAIGILKKKADQLER